MRMKNAGIAGAVVTFLTSEQGKRLIREARRRYDTPTNRAKVAATVDRLRPHRG